MAESQIIERSDTATIIRTGNNGQKLTFINDPLTGAPYVPNQLSVNLYNLLYPKNSKGGAATTNNFLGTRFYDEARAFMQRPAAEAVVRALMDGKAIAARLRCEHAETDVHAHELARLGHGAVEHLHRRAM